MFVNSRIRVLFAILIGVGAATGQVINTAAGSTTWGGPTDVAMDTAGNFYVADWLGHKVYKVDRLATVTTIAGTGTAGNRGDGALATDAQLNGPLSVVVDPDGTIYIADYNNARIRRIAPNGIITTYAGDGTAPFKGDNGPATGSSIYQPMDITLDKDGNLLIADYGHARIRKVTKSTGVITTIAGTGRRASTGDNGPPLAADIDPATLVVAGDGSIYFGDSSYRGNPSGPKVRKIAANGSSITTVAGNGVRKESGDGGPSLQASFLSIDGIALDPVGNLYVAEFDGSKIRKISASGIVTTFAGTGTAGLAGDGGDAVKALMSGPVGMIMDAQGNLLLADYYNKRVRRISPAPTPTLSANDFAVPSFLGKSGFSSNTYMEIHGTSLSQTTRLWAGSDFNGSNAPTALDGVSVTVNNKPAFVYYISPTQININTPDDTATGPVAIQVKNALGTSNIQMANRSRLSPAMHSDPNFIIGGKPYLVAFTPDFLTFIGRPNMIPGLAFAPAKPGSIISFYALGCGSTNPPTQAGVAAAQGSSVASSYELRIGGVAANVTFFGVLGGTVGLYQVNAVVPQVPAGDQTIELIVDGVSNAQGLSIVIGQ